MQGVKNGQPQLRLVLKFFSVQARAQERERVLKAPRWEATPRGQKTNQPTDCKIACS